jgi:PPE-repeat protein
MDFGALPPEINSARMYAGPGATPMMTAASAWDQVAAELDSAALSYASVISTLTEGSWYGPASASMATAVAPYVAWMNTAAAQAEQTAVQAKSAAAAYETAFAMTIPPAVIGANRTQLAALVATNLLGQNTAAIAATEAQYAQMWAQDAAAMYGYAGASAAAATVPPLNAPPETAGPAGTVGQAGAVAQATGTSTTSGLQSTLSQVISTVPPALQSLASPVQSVAPTSIFSDIGTPVGLAPGDVSNAISNLASSSFTPMSLAGISQFGADLSVIHALSAVAPGADASGVAGEGVAAMGAVGPAGAASIGSAPVSAGVGQATLVGTISVPQSWAAAAPAAIPTAGSLPAAADGWAIPPGAGMAEMAPPAGTPGMPGVPGGGLANRGYGFAAPRYGFKPTVVTRPPAAG